MAKLKCGDRVLLENTYLEEYEGTIEYISPEKVVLHTIHCKKTKTCYAGDITFYRNEVRRLVRISGSSDLEASSVTESQKTLKIMHVDEFNRLQHVAYDFVFIDKFGTRFNEAIEVLKNRESVAVVELGYPISLLVMADFKQVFIFDLWCLVELKQLRDILESTFICKVVHGGGALFHCLYHKYGVEMKNIFDTQIVDNIMTREEKKINIIRNISECLDYHFNIPPTELSQAMEDRDNIWRTRPIPKSDKIKSAQLAVYLISLRDRLMEKILEKYTKKIKADYSKYINMSDFDILKLKKTLKADLQ